MATSIEYALMAGASCFETRSAIGKFPLSTGVAAQQFLIQLVRLFLALAAAAHVTACSTIVQWAEEVPLNTGETIWVNRTVVYSERGGAGNPLDVRSRPDRDEAIDFTWNGKQYSYKGDARILLLAISPQNEPVLVAGAEDNSWRARHNYPCTFPY